MSYDSTLAGLGIARTGAATSATTTDTSKLGQRSLGQDDFLKLLTAQMQNQDPFEPVDNTQMVAQMAQFSSLSGITEMSATLSAIAAKLGATSATDAVGWVGKNVLTEGSVAYGRDGGGLTGAIELDAAATDVSVTIKGADGTTLRTVSLGAQSAGTIDYAWDGTTDAGAAAGNGPFTVAVAATGSDGAKLAARGLVWAPVASVSIPSSGNPVLTLPGIGQVATTAVRQVG